jgi:acetyl esterase/lipase
VVQLLARDEKLTIPITGSILTIPITTNIKNPPAQYVKELVSWKQNENAPILSTAMVHKFIDAYNPVGNQKLFDVLGGYEDFSGLGPTFFQICGLDPLRDEGMIYERILREKHGVKTKMHVYPGLPHGFASFLAQSPKSEAFRKDTIAGVEWVLSQK